MILEKLIRTSVAALGTLAVASVTQANAADVYAGGGGYKDVPVYVAPTWAGFYVGANAGVAWSQLDLNGGQFWDDHWTGGLKGTDGKWTGGADTPYNFNKGNIESTNGFIGGQFGFNWQQSGCCFVYGIEVDLGGVGLNMNNHRFLQTPGDWRISGVGFDMNNNDFDFVGDITGRIGYTWGNTLLYAKGGFAFLDANNGLNETIYWRNNTVAHPSPTDNNWDTYGSNNQNWLTGWTVGAGLEWKVSPSWSVKIEYLHFDFSDNFNFGNDWFAQNTYANGSYNRWKNNNDLTSDTVKVGFNYFWSPAPVAAPLK